MCWMQIKAHLKIWENDDMKYSSIKKDRPDLFNNQNALFPIVLDEEEIQSWQSTRREELAQRGNPEAWADIGVVFDDPYVIILRDLVEFADGSHNGYMRL